MTYTYSILISLSVPRGERPLHRNDKPLNTASIVAQTTSIRRSADYGRIATVAQIER